jgi:hypothetical protein
MRSLLLALPVLAVALQPSVAEASGCYRGPFAPLSIPAGCPITVYQDPASSPDTPRVFATRDGIALDITGASEKSTTTLDVGQPEYDCSGAIEKLTLYPTPYDVYRVQVVDPIVGETLAIGGWPVRVAEPGPCVELATPEPICGYAPEPCKDEHDEEEHDDDTGGCNTGSGAGLAFGILALALAIRARR